MATYDNCASINVAIRYQAVEGSPWLGEVWQTHLRLLAVPGPNLALDSGRVTPDLFAVKDSATSRTAGGFDIEAGWVGAAKGSYTITDADLDDVLSGISTFLKALRPQLSSQYEVESVRFYPMLKGGGSPWRAGVSATAPIICRPTDATHNPTGASMYPPDVALAISLGTGTRGPSGRGRMFLGGLNKELGTAFGLVAKAGSDALGDMTVNLLSDIRVINLGSALPVYRFCPVIYTSRPNKSGANADTASVINHVRISDEFDTQRRRDHQRQDVYHSYGPIS